MEQQIQAAEAIENAGAPAEAEAPLSIMEHAAEFGTNRDRSPVVGTELPSDATPEQKAAHHSEQQRREKETGKFEPGRRRHRAASQQATAADVPRIAALTREKNELKAQLDAANARLAAPAPPQAQPRQEPPQRQAQATDAAQGQPRAAAPSLLPRVSDPRDPEPKETDEKYGKSANGPLEYFQDWSRWNVRDEHRQVVAQQQRQQEEFQANASFASRAKAVHDKYADFPDVVGRLDASQRIPAGSVIDQFILTDDTGPEVLYHLATNPQDLDALLRVPVFQQMKYLALLSQRFDSASSPQQSAQAGTTGSAARQTVRFLPPKPPNPVRTEAQRASGGPPPTDGTLSVMSHAKQFRRS